MTVGIRLKEERKRLGLTQSAMAIACGVSKRTQIFYEGDSVGASAAYLTAAHELGADIVYLLTGERQRLSEGDADVLDAWRKATPQARVAALSVLAGTAPEADVAARTVFSNASIGQQFSGDVDLRGQQVVVKSPKPAKKPAK